MRQTDMRDVEALIERALARRADDVELGDLRPGRPAPARPGWIRRLPTSVWGLPAVAAACAMLVVVGALTAMAALTRDSPPSGEVASPTLSGTGEPSPSVSTSAEPSPTPTSAAPVVSCGAQDVQLSPSPNPDYTGQPGYSGDGLWILLVFANVSATPCQMPLYPSAAVLDSAGRFVESVARWDGTGWVGTGRPGSPQIVTIAPGRTASAFLQWGPLAYQPGETCSVNADVAVSLSDEAMDGQRLSMFPGLGFPMRMCGESVTPFVAGSTGTTSSGPVASSPSPGASVEPGSCRPQDVTLSPSRYGTYSGDGLWIVLVYTNVSATPCAMPLYPSAAVLDSGGRLVEPVGRWDGTGGVVPGLPGSPRAVTVAPGESASAILQWGAAAYQPGEACSVNADVAVSLSDDAAGGQHLSAFPELGFPVRMCGESVTPFVAGSTGTT